MFRRVALASALLVSPASSAAETLVIRVQADGWGDAEAGDIRKVLESAGRELLRHAPPPRPIRVRVVPTGDAPQVDHARAADGEYTIRLAARDRQWAQFAFQFAHELGHVVSNYERRVENKLGAENQWLDEAVGEAASIFVLERMAEAWKSEPPYANWKGYAASLADYAAQRRRAAESPPREKMPEWFKANRGRLRADPYRRELNRAVAVHLADLLARDPDDWEAVRFLNLGRPDASNGFEAHVENWYFSVPAARKPFVKAVADLLGVRSAAIAAHAEK
jgi:hypothetical protein